MLVVQCTGKKSESEPSLVRIAGQPVQAGA